MQDNREHKTMMTIEQARELLGTLPKEVDGDEADPWEQEAFLEYWSWFLKHPYYGEGWMRERRVSIISAWEYIRTLV
jgi:hypothetical protein